jgi:hypothetical protein
MLGGRLTTGGLQLLSFIPRSLPALAGLAVTAIVSPALAQVQSVTPYYGVVTVDKAKVHCGDNDRFYRIGELPTGWVVVVDGEGSAWSRIGYPSSFPALVRVQDVKIEGTAATLIEPSKLRAGNATAGYTLANSWKSLLDVPLPTGTKFDVLEAVKEGESVVGYKVTAPQAARAFVETRALRHATEAEVAAFKAKSSLPTLPSAATPIPGNPTPSATPAGNPAVNPTVPSGTPSNGGTETATAPANTTGVQPVKTPDVTPAFPAEAKGTERAVGSLEALENRFKEVWKQENAGAEVGEMKTEFERALAGTPEDQVGRRKALQNRINALQMRLDLYDKVRKQEEARARIDSNKTELTKQIEQWEQSRVYTIVGELRPSTVYDGKNLPLMYRIVSVGGTSPKTLGYLKSSKEVDLTKMLGQVVGVIGEATMDRSLKLNIVSAVKVDVLRSAPSPAPAQPAGTTANVEENGDGPMEK